MTSKGMSGCGDSGGELTIPSEDEGTSMTSHIPALPSPMIRRMSEPPLKEPWVPAPGRTSKVRSHSVLSSVVKPYVEYGAANEDDVVPGKDFPKEGKASSLSLGKEKKRNGRSKSKRSHSIDERKLSELTLQTKDSLIDVTAYLNKRRDEVFELWEKHVLDCDPVLLTELQNANTLAVETVNDVNELRKSIDKLKKKSGKLSEEDNVELDLLRNRILSKLALFEASQEQIHQRLRDSRDASKNRTSRNSSTHAKSIYSESHLHDSPAPKEVQEYQNNPLVPIPSSLIYLKEKSKSFSDAEDTEVDVDFDDFDEPAFELKQSVKFDLESVEGEGQGGTEKQLPVSEKKAKSQSPAVKSSTFDKMNPAILVDSIYYRDKIRGLHKKLMIQEAKCVEMKREMKRIESQNEFEVKLLKSNMKAQVDDLAHLPEMLEFTEERLNESLHAKFAIESSLQMKINELNSVKCEAGRLGKDLDSTQSKLITAEAKNETLTKKLEALDAENRELRMEVWNKGQLLASREANAASNSKEIQKEKESRKLLFLEDKIGELEAELETANKETLTMRRAKNEISSRLNRRIEELMDALEMSRAKSRSLQNKITMIKTKYFQLFVTPVESNQNIFPETMKILAEAKAGNERPLDGSSLN